MLCVWYISIHLTIKRRFSCCHGRWDDLWFGIDETAHPLAVVLCSDHDLPVVTDVWPCDSGGWLLEQLVTAVCSMLFFLCVWWGQSLSFHCCQEDWSLAHYSGRLCSLNVALLLFRKAPWGCMNLVPAHQFRLCVCVCVSDSLQPPIFIPP